ncbi:hypothetical protein NGA_0723700, partial [Nannochloropsis gaditana CCMP526]
MSIANTAPPKPARRSSVGPGVPPFTPLHGSPPLEPSSDEAASPDTFASPPWRQAQAPPSSETGAAARKAEDVDDGSYVDEILEGVSGLGLGSLGPLQGDWLPQIAAILEQVHLKSKERDPEAPDI